MNLKAGRVRIEACEIVARILKHCKDALGLLGRATIACPGGHSADRSLVATEAKYDVLVGVNAIGEAAQRFEKAARDVIYAARTFAEQVDEQNGPSLSVDTAIDAARRARVIIDDIEQHQVPAVQILDEAQELVELVSYFIARKAVA